MNEAQDKLLIPVTIGVTGHRDLRPEDIPALEEQVHKIITGLKEKYPDSPLVIISPLAEGADRLVARIGLKLGAELYTPLPMEKDEYIRDFDTPESLNEFESLLRQSAQSFALDYVDGNTLQDVQNSTAARDKQYAAVGRYVALHSHILIALWDGYDSAGDAGTGAVVHLKLEGMTPGQATSGTFPGGTENGPVYHVVTPRTSCPVPDGDSLACMKIYPDEWHDEKKEKKGKNSAETLFHRILKSIDDFNREAAERFKKIQNRIDNSINSLIVPEERENLDDIANLLLYRYGLADVLAAKNRSWRMLNIRALFALVALAIICLLVHIEFTGSALYMILFVLFLLTAIIWYLVAKYHKYELKHEDYRALAEAFRVQFFWLISGIKENVSDHYLFKHKGELEWLRFAIRSWTLKIPLVNPAGAHLALTRKYWVLDQRDWFKKRADRNLKLLEWFNGFSSLLFILGAALAIWFIFSYFNKYGMNGFDLEQLFSEDKNHVITFFISILFALSAVCLEYSDLLGLSEQYKQYHRMHLFFLKASRILELFSNKPEDVVNRKVIFELGREALAENGDWLMLHRARPLVIPRL